MTEQTAARVLGGLLKSDGVTKSLEVMAASMAIVVAEDTLRRQDATAEILARAQEKYSVWMNLVATIETWCAVHVEREE